MLSIRWQVRVRCLHKKEHNKHVRVTTDRLGAHANCCNKITSEAHKKANALKLAKTCSVSPASGPSKIRLCRLSRGVCVALCVVATKWKWMIAPTNLFRCLVFRPIPYPNPSPIRPARRHRCVNRKCLSCATESRVPREVTRTTVAPTAPNSLHKTDF